MKQYNLNFTISTHLVLAGVVSLFVFGISHAFLLILRGCLVGGMGWEMENRFAMVHANEEVYC